MDYYDMQEIAYREIAKVLRYGKPFYARATTEWGGVRWRGREVTFGSANGLWLHWWDSKTEIEGLDNELKCQHVLGTTPKGKALVMKLREIKQNHILTNAGRRQP